MGAVQEFGFPANGKWTQLDDGGWLWTVGVAATGAKAIRVRISNWRPPVGAELILFNPNQTDFALGPLDITFPPTTDTLWTPTIYSDVVHLEYYLPPHLDHSAPELQLDVDALLNQYRSRLEDLPGADDRTDPLECHLDVTCYEDWQSEADGVGALSYISFPWAFFCSGAMLHRVPGDFTPIFMTARHCGVDGSNVTTLLVEWFWQSNSCNGSPPDPTTLPQTPGVVLLVNDAFTDFSLVGLASDNTGGVSYLGWDNTYWPDQYTGTTIHHPIGSFKRITFATKQGDVISCHNGQAWSLTVLDGDGEVEPNSSGAPIFDVSRHIRGTASCFDWGCSQANILEYGRFDMAYQALDAFLDPVDPVYVDGSYVGSQEGTSEEPFRNVRRGVFAVREGSDLHIEDGSYDERFKIDKSMTLHARNGSVTIGQ
jgi:hypothetical protein